MNSDRPSGKRGRIVLNKQAPELNAVPGVCVRPRGKALQLFQHGFIPQNILSLWQQRKIIILRTVNSTGGCTSDYRVVGEHFDYSY